MLELERLAVGYNKKILLDQLNICVEAGKIVTLIGPNGSGKSTILKTITRQLEAIDGVILLDDIRMDELSGEDIAKRVSMVMTERVPGELMSCREIVATGRYPYTGRLGILSDEDWEIVDETIHLLHADDIANQLFTEMSDGQKQRIMLARALCQEAGILILDEPTSYLDMRYKLELLSSIRSLARERKIAVFMSLHELDLAYRISDEIVCIEGDKIGRIGTPEEIFQDGYIQKLYGIELEEFDEQLGMINFPPQQGEPKVFVIAGGGNGAGIFYFLQRNHIPFAVGVLHKNDLDYHIAKSTASSVLAVEPFQIIEADDIREAMKVMDTCDYCINVIEEFGPANEKNRELIAYAKKQSKLTDELGCILTALG